MDCIHVVIIAVIRANVDFLVLEPHFSPVHSLIFVVMHQMQIGSYVIVMTNHQIP